MRLSFEKTRAGDPITITIEIINDTTKTYIEDVATFSTREQLEKFVLEKVSDSFDENNKIE